MTKKACLLLSAIALLLTAASLLLSFRGNNAPRLSGRAMKLSAAQAESLDIYHGDHLFASFSRSPEGNAWQVDLPELQARKNKADRVSMEDLLAFAGRTQAVPAKGVSRAEAGLEGGNVLQFVIRKSKETSSVYLGNYSKDGSVRYFASDEDPRTVLQTESGLTRVFDRDARALRSLDLFELGGRGPDRITIQPSPGEKTLVLDLTPEGWVISSPVSWPADSARVGSLLRFCSLLRATAIEPAGTTLGDESRLPSITLRIGGKEQKALFSLAKDGKQLARRADRPEVYELPKGLLDVLVGATADAMRSHKLSLLNNREVAAVDFTGESGEKLTLTQKDGIWTASGAAAFPVEKTAVDHLLNALNNLVIRDVAGDGEGSLTEFGLDRPEMTISAGDAGGAELLNLKVASVPLAAPLQGPARYYAKTSARKEVVELEPLLGNYFLQDFIQYRSRLVCNDDFKDVLKIQISGPEFEREYWQNSPTQYQIVKPVTALLSEKGNWEMLRLAKDLAGLRCEGYVPQKKAKNADFGLDQPQLKTILTMRSEAGGAHGVQKELRIGRSVKLEGGAAASGSGEQEYYYASYTGVGNVFILNKKFVERLLMEYK